MDYTIIILNFVYALIGLGILYFAYWIFDKMTPQLDFPEELKKGNLAVAIVIGALFIALGIIIGGALN
ncbi:MAG: DUF350 domain-containing protein [Ignavibacteria bacterium]|nr:DUF350 domain-containing protein [Ignavibacteria bacterium]